MNYIYRFVLTFLLLCAATTQAAYVPRYSETVTGGLTWTGNALGLSKSENPTAPGVQDSQGAFSSLDTSLKVGTYPAGTTLDWNLNGSSAVLDIPVGSQILYAELIWSGTYGSGGIIGPVLNTPISFTNPDNVVSSITRDLVTSQNVNASGRDYYVRSADVTNLITGSGTYSVEGVPSLVGNLDGNAAGWTLAVAYSNPNMALSELLIYVVGESSVSAGNNQPVPGFEITGFIAPTSLTNTSRLFISALEGDTNKDGDRLLVSPNALLTKNSDAVQGSGPNGSNNFLNNFFASQINTLLPVTLDPNTNLLAATGSSQLDTRGTFGNRNGNAATGTVTVGQRQGYDITSIDISNKINAGQQALYLVGTGSNQEIYIINALGLQIETAEPLLTGNKSVTPSTVNSIGDTVTFTTNFSNNSQVTAFNLSFIDNLPAGLSYVNNSLQINGIPSANQNIVTGVALGDLLVGNSVTVTFDAQVTAINPPTTYFNTAQVNYFASSTAIDPIVAVTNTVVVTANDVNLPIIGGVKDVFPTNVDALGDIVTFNLFFSNTGDGIAYNTIFRDILPDGLTYVANSLAINSIPSVNQDIVAGVPLGDIPPNANIKVAFQAQVTAINPPILYTNTASLDYFLTPDSTDPLTILTNPAILEVVDAPLPIINATKTADPIIVNALGDLVTFTSTFSNVGLGTAYNLSFIDILPSGLTYSMNSLQINGIASVNQDIINGVPLGDLIAGATTTVTFQAEVSAINPPLFYVNTALANYFLTPTSIDPQTATTNSVTVAAAPILVPLVNAAKTANLSVVNELGDQVTFTTTFSNTGDGIAYNLVFIDQLPNGLSYIPNSLLVDEVSSVNQNISTGVPLGNLAAGESITVTLRARVTAINPPLTYVNIALANYFLTPDGTDPLTASSNSVTIRAVVTPPPTPRPKPPRDYVGVITKQKFLNKTVSCLKMTWKASLSPDVRSYRIYYKNKVIIEVLVDNVTRIKALARPTNQTYEVTIPLSRDQPRTKTGANTPETIIERPSDFPKNEREAQELIIRAKIAARPDQPLVKPISSPVLIKIKN